MSGTLRPLGAFAMLAGDERQDAARRPRITADVDSSCQLSVNFFAPRTASLRATGKIRTPSGLLFCTCGAAKGLFRVQKEVTYRRKGR